MFPKRHTCIIIGVGPFISLSLSKKLATLGWDLALISSSADKLSGYASDIKTVASSTGKEVKVVTRAADAGNEAELKKALAWAKGEMGTVEVCVYNAALVRETDLMTMTTETVEQDFKISVLGMLVTGQWFAANADTTSNPLLILTSGVLHDHPYPNSASLSTVKSASWNLSKNFAQVLPEKYGIKVGIPMIVQPIIPDGKGGYQTKSVPDDIVREIFLPFIEAKNEERGGWVRDRVW